MRSQLLTQLKTPILLFTTLLVVTGIVYPIVVTLIAQTLFPWQANGSFIAVDNKPLGSVLIGQSFDSPRYFWGRPSATPTFPYNALNSSGANISPTSLEFLAIVKARVATLQHADPTHHALIPIDLVTASASGLDPDISPLAAFYQAPRIAAARSIPLREVENLIENTIKTRTLGLLGEPRLNVLQLNVTLDHLNVSRQS